MMDPDRQLAMQCKSGDRAALELLFRRHVDRVWRYGWFATRSREDAADIVQDTFLRVARSIGQFEGRSTFATWLYALTRSAAMEHLRKKKLAQTSPEREAIFRLVPPQQEEPEDHVGESRHEIRAAIAVLPEAHRDAIILCELLGMSIAEAGAVFGWKDARVKVTLFRARRKLAEILRRQTDEHTKKRVSGCDELH